MKQAKKYCRSYIIVSLPKKTVSLPVNCSKEPETPSKSTISIQTCETPVEPKTSPNSANSMREFNVNWKPKFNQRKQCSCHSKLTKMFQCILYQSPPNTSGHTLVALKDNHIIVKTMIFGTQKVSFKSNSSLYSTPNEPYSTRSSKENSNYVPDIVEVEQQRYVQLFCLEIISKTLDHLFQIFKRASWGSQSYSNSITNGSWGEKNATGNKCLHSWR